MRHRVQHWAESVVRSAEVEELRVVNQQSPVQVVYVNYASTQRRIRVRKNDIIQSQVRKLLWVYVDAAAFTRPWVWNWKLVAQRFLVSEGRSGKRHVHCWLDRTYFAIDGYHSTLVHSVVVLELSICDRCWRCISDIYCSSLSCVVIIEDSVWTYWQSAPVTINSSSVGGLVILISWSRFSERNWACQCRSHVENWAHVHCVAVLVGVVWAYDWSCVFNVKSLLLLVLHDGAPQVRIYCRIAVRNCRAAEGLVFEGEGSSWRVWPKEGPLLGLRHLKFLEGSGSSWPFNDEFFHIHDKEDTALHILRWAVEESCLCLNKHGKICMINKEGPTLIARQRVRELDWTCESYERRIRPCFWSVNHATLIWSVRILNHNVGESYRNLFICVKKPSIVALIVGIHCILDIQCAVFAIELASLNGCIVVVLWASNVRQSSVFNKKSSAYVS